MSAYNPPMETLPRFNTTAFIQNSNVTYPVAQGSLTIPKQIRIVDGSNTIIITPTSIIINGIVYSLSNIAYLNLSQTFTGVNSFSNSILTNNIDALNTTTNATLFSNLTNRLFIGNPAGNIVIDGLTTTFTNPILCDIIRGTLAVNAVSLYTTTTGGVTIGNSSGTNVLQGATTITNLLTNSINPITPTNNIQIGNTQTTGNMNIAPNTNGNITIGGLNSINTYMFGTNVVIGFPSQSITLQGNTQSSGVLTAETIRPIVLSNPIRLYDTSTGTITIGNPGISTNTINGNTTITNTLLANTLTGTLVGSSISLFTTSTGTITLGNTGSTNTINGITTFNETLFAPTPASLLNTTRVPTTAYLTSYYPSLSSNNSYSGTNTFTSTILCNTITGTLVGNAISLFTTSTGTITLGNTVSTNTINGITTFNEALFAPTPASLLNTTRVPTTAYLTSYYPSLSSNNSYSGTNTFTSTILCNTITGTLVGNAISLFTTSTGTITLGNTVSTNTINGITTFNEALFAPTPASLLNTTRVPTTAYLTSYYPSLSSNNSYSGINTFTSTVICDTITGTSVGSSISLYTTTTGTITLGNTGSTNTINGVTTFNQALSAPTPVSQLNTTRVPTTAYLTTYYPSLSSNNSLIGTNTFTSTVLCNTITGTSVGSAISLFTTSTGTIALGNPASTNTINGITTFYEALSAPTPASQLNTSRVPTTAYLTTYYAPLTGTIANATAITLTPNTTDTLGYITFSSTASGSSNIKTNTGLTFNASTGELTASSANTNTIQGQTASSAISLYTTSTSGGITLGNTSNLNTINGNTTMTNTLIVNTIHSIASGTTVNLCNNLTTGSIIVGSNLTSGLITIGRTAQTGSVTINGALTTGTNSLFNNSTTSAININTARTGGVLTIGNSSTTLVTANTNIHGTSVTGVNNLFTNTTTANSNILTSLTSGTLIIGNATQTGAVTLHGATSVTNSIFGNTTTGLINIGTGLTSGGRVVVGTTVGTITLNGETTITNTLDANTIQGTTVSSPISLYTNNTSGNIDIGNSLNTITVNGATRFFQTVTVETIEGANPASNINLYNNITTGAVNFLSSITSGAVTIGRALQTGIMTIYGSTTNASNLFTNVTSGTINIGSSTSTTNIFGIIKGNNGTLLGTPVGTVITFAGTTAPDGYLLCDGSQYATTGTYANLFAVIGTTYGSSAGNFYVPDLRGAWIRGFNDGTATYNNNRGIAGPSNYISNAIGTSQGNQVGTHSHAFGVSGSYSTSATSTMNKVPGPIDTYSIGNSGTFPTNTGQNVGGAETRVYNFAMNYYIKY